MANKLKQLYNVGLTMLQIYNLPMSSILNTIVPVYGLPHVGKVKAVKLEGKFTVVKCDRYNSDTDKYLVVRKHNTNDMYSIINSDEFLSGFELAIKVEESRCKSVGFYKGAPGE